MMKISLSPKLRKRLRRLAILSVVALGLVILQPFLWGFVEQLADLLHENRSEVRQITEINQRVDEIKEDQNEQRALLGQLTAVVPTSDEILRILGRLEGVAGQFGLTVEVESIIEQEPDGTGANLLSPVTGQSSALPAVNPGGQPLPQTPPGTQPGVGVQPVTGVGQLLPLAVTVSTKGPANVLLAYVAAVEHAPELTQVRLITIVPVAPGGVEEVESNTFELEMEVVFYLQQDNGEET